MCCAPTCYSVLELLPLTSISRLRKQSNTKTTPKTKANRKEVKDKRNERLRPGGEHLTPDQMEKVLAAAKTIEPGERNWLMVLLAYQHGLRCEELLSLRWPMVNLDTGHIWIKRLKKGKSGSHPLMGEEGAAIKKFQKTRQTQHDYIFHSPQGSRLTGARFRQIVAQAGRLAKLPFPIHPHMLRHSAGYKLINHGQDLKKIARWLGHSTVQHTDRYTALAANAFDSFKEIWKD